MAHNEARNPDSIPIDFTDCYDDTLETNRRGGAELNSNWPMTR